MSVCTVGSALLHPGPGKWPRCSVLRFRKENKMMLKFRECFSMVELIAYLIESQLALWKCSLKTRCLGGCGPGTSLGLCNAVVLRVCLHPAQTLISLQSPQQVRQPGVNVARRRPPALALRAVSRLAVIHEELT